VILTAPVSALCADFRVLPDGTTYQAAVEVTGSEYGFWMQGLLGERVPLAVDDVQVIGASGQVEYRKVNAATIAFPAGNYTIRYRAPIRDNHIQAVFDEPYSVTVHLPPGLDVQNPLLGLISPGGRVTEEENGSITIRWDRAPYVEVRFYDPGREILLNTFGTIWMIAAIVLLLPYLLSRRR